jgi:hypothetical protein
MKARRLAASLQDCQRATVTASLATSPRGAAYAERQADENRRQSRRIERRQEGDKGGFQEIGGRRRVPFAPWVLPRRRAAQGPRLSLGPLDAGEFDNTLKYLARGGGAAMARGLEIG